MAIVGILIATAGILSTIGLPAVNAVFIKPRHPVPVLWHGLLFGFILLSILGLSIRGRNPWKKKTNRSKRELSTGLSYVLEYKSEFDTGGRFFMKKFVLTETLEVGTQSYGLWLRITQMNSFLFTLGVSGVIVQIASPFIIWFAHHRPRTAAATAAGGNSIQHDRTVHKLLVVSELTTDAYMLMFNIFTMSSGLTEY